VFTRIFIENIRDESRVEMFDNTRTISPHHKVVIIESRIVLGGSGTDKFIPLAEQPQEQRPSKSYYTIVMGLYPTTHFRHCEPDMADVASKHKIPWFIVGNSYPLTPRLPNTEDFLGKCYPYLGYLSDRTDGSEEVALAPGALSIWSSVRPDVAQGWMPATQSTSWVEYGEAHIEVPTGDRQISLCDPSHERIVSFNPRSIELW
jgi:hypothetical protein